jgi:hypothetical protein
MGCGHFRQPGLLPEDFFGISENPGPAKRTHFIDDFCRVCPAERQIAPMYYQIRRNPLQVRKNRL